MRGTALVLGILAIGLTVLMGYALWHLLNDEKTYPEKTATTEHIDLEALEAPLVEPEAESPKETIPTSQLYIPPMTVSGPTSDHTGYSISGMGGNWRPLRKLVPRRRHHWLRQDPLHKEDA